MTKQRSPKKITNTPAAFLPGLYSLQAVTAIKGQPDVTIYRTSVDAVLNWKDAAVRRNVFSRFLLRHAVDAWDVYSADGRLESLCSDVVDKRSTSQPCAVDVDPATLHAEARSTLGNAHSCLIHAGDHAAAASVDHSNYGFVLKTMIRDADPQDLPCVYVVESHTWPCRVSGIYADFEHLSVAAQNCYLDMYPALRSQRPLDVEDYKRLFVNRAALLQGEHLSDVCAKAGVLRGLDDDEILAMRLNIGARGVEFRRKLAAELLQLTGGNPVASRQGKAEELNVSTLANISDQIVAAAFKL